VIPAKHDARIERYMVHDARYRDSGYRIKDLNSTSKPPNKQTGITGSTGSTGPTGHDAGYKMEDLISASKPPNGQTGSTGSTDQDAGYCMWDTGCAAQ